MSGTAADAREKMLRAAFLKRVKEEAVSRRSKGQNVEIGVADRGQPLPLSWAQQRLWFLHQLDPAASVAYHMATALRLSGHLDRAALQATLDRIVARHEILRTTFASGADGNPVQVIAGADRGFVLIDHDLRGMDDAEQALAIAEQRDSEARAPFDLVAGPLIRGRLLRLAEDKHVLLVTEHHIASDGWSTGVLIKEVSALYLAYSQGQADPLPPLAVQYADYAVWQRQQGDTLNEQLGFWREHLEGAPALLALPTDRPRPAAQSYRGGEVEFQLSAELTSGLRALSQCHGTTMFMTFMAGWSILLSRLSGQDDVVIGTPAANRQRAEIEPLIGFFLNTLALRTRLHDDPTVADVLAQAKATALNVYTYQDLPFEQVVEALQPARSLGHSPLFQASFTWHNQPGGGELTLPGLTLAEMENPTKSAKLDLSLHLADAGEFFSGSVVYASDLFNAGTVERWVGHFQTLLGSMVLDPAMRVSQLPLLTPSEQARILTDFNDTATDYPRERLIHQLFEEKAAQRPEGVALVFENHQLSYGELNRRANQVAHYLLSLGVKPDDRVAICMERSIEMVVGVLGILKAGGAYVPLDPNSPIERLANMLDDSAPVALLTQSDLEGDLPVVDIPVLRMDIDLAVLAHRLPDHDPDPAAQGLASRHLAYVMYTSGSTGRPKGVMVEHRNVLRLIFNAAYFEATSEDCFAHCANPAFDASTWEIWGALLHGARVVVIPHYVVLSEELFAAALLRHRISALFLTIGLFNKYVDALRAPLGNLRYLIVGGDVLDPVPIARVLRREPRPFCFMSAYGPTEATTYASTYEIESISEGRSIPIGRPIGNTQFYILDAHRQPVPIGVVGEIHIGGAGVARGYLNRPELTAERFIADPFGARVGARIYKTGDLGRWLPDGNIEFMGRNDFQVKIRGFRVELGEIEAKLSACEGVRDSAVIAREDIPGDKRLVAYMVAHEGVTLSAAALRESLSRELPDYMVPSAFVSLEALPLTRNGKLDRPALPAPDSSAVVSREYQAPQGDIEEAIAAVWQELLGLERVGRHDNFFELGGHSLLAVSMIERLRQRGWNLNVRAIFSAPTLAALAALADAIGESDSSESSSSSHANRIPADSPTIEPEMLTLVELTQSEIDRIIAAVPNGGANIQDIYPCTPAQEGFLFHHLMQHEGDAYLIQWALALDSRARLDGFLDALQLVINRHDIMRTAIHWEGLPQPIQVVQRTARLSVTELQLVPGQSAVEQILAATDPSRSRLNLRNAPLMAAYTAEDAETGEWLLVLLNHHSIEDNYSLQLLLSEVRMLLQGRGAELPQPQPFRNAVARALSVPKAEHEAFFRRELGHIDHPTAPFGVLDVQQDGRNIREATIALTDSQVQSIRSCAARQKVSTALLFHIGWAQVLALCTGQDEVVFGTVLSGRMQGGVGSESALGMFINTLPFRVNLASGDANQVLQDCQKRMTELLTYEHASLALAQGCSGVAAPLPLFTALMNYRRPDVVEQANEKGGEAAVIEGIRVVEAVERTNYPVDVSVNDHSDGIELNAQCVADIDPHRLNAYLITAVESLVNALEQGSSRPLHTQGVMPEAERHQLLEEWNTTEREYARDACLHELFEAQVARMPAAVAVVFGEQRLSYGALNERANRLAHYLVAERGVGPDTLVGVCLERSLDMVVALLGILKAGGAYVPLDPSYPAERLAYMREDAKLTVVVTHQAWVTQGLLGEARGLCLDAPEIAAVLAQQPTEDVSPASRGLTSSHLAYVIYTSGSTGQPKGVMVEHGGLINLVQAVKDHYGLKPEDAVLQFASVNFDVSVEEIFGALCNGCRLVLRDDEWLSSTAHFWRRCEENGLTVLNLPTAFWHELVADQALPGPTVRHISVGGEKLSDGAIRAWHAKVGEMPVLVNAYGPTECSVNASLTTVTAGMDNHIGRAMANLAFYVLDAKLQPVPIGVPGELYLGGVGLARGYWNREELTRERFIPNPFQRTGQASSSARLYRTGDLVRWRADGQLEYIGRTDHQVKLRGFRIELGEIEHALCRHEAVSEALVQLHQPGGDPRLVAYLIGEPTAEAAVRAHLATVLPEYMVPSVFVWLDAFPLNLNGKVDRRALPAPDGSAVASRDYAAPQGETEETIAAIWQELLGLERVGRNDDFFELGGHSLLAVRMVSRLSQTLGVDVSMRVLFARRTLSRFSDSVELRQPENAFPNLVEVRSEGNQSPLFLVHPGEGEVAYAFTLAGSLHPDLPVYALAASGFLENESPLDSVEEMAARYIRAIRHVQPRGPYRVAGWSAGGTIAYEMAAQLIGMDEHVEFLGLIDTSSSYLEPDGGVESAADEDEFALLVSALVAESPGDAVRRVDILGLGGSLDAAISLGQAKGLLPKDVTPAIAKRHLSVRAGINRALRRYVPEPLPIPLSLFVATEEVCSDLRAGWHDLARGNLTAEFVSGTHYSIMEPPGIAILGGKISDALRRSAGDHTSSLEAKYSPLLLVQKGDRRLQPIFCVPGAGDTVTRFCAFANAIGPEYPVYGLQPRGLDGELVPHMSVGSAAACYIDAIKKVCPEGPYRLIGHSFGGWVAFEMAQQLVRMGDRVDSLILLDSQPPSPKDASETRIHRIPALLKLIGLLEMSAKCSLEIGEDDLAKRDHRQQLTLLLEMGVRAKLFSPKTSLAAIAGMVRVFSVNINTRYVPEGAYEGSAYLVSASNGRDGPQDRLGMLQGWRQYVTDVRVHESAGDHFAMLLSPSVDDLAIWARRLLNQGNDE